MTALAKPDWPDQTKISKGDWGALIAGGSFSFTVRGFQEKDARYDADAVVTRLCRRPDGALMCDEPQCPAPVSGATAHTQSRHSAFKHLRAYHGPGRVIDLDKKAAMGLYGPKQYEEAELEEDILAWRLGGRASTTSRTTAKRAARA
jgi:hypothetical protein